MATKLEYHKIRGIPKDICTAEQKIAYNLAFLAHISFQDQFDKIKDYPTNVISDFIYQVRDFEIKRYQRDNDKKYNIDAIQSALSAGLLNYFKKPFIASNYETIGKSFPAHYL